MVCISIVKVDLFDYPSVYRKLSVDFFSFMKESFLTACNATYMRMHD